VASTGTGKTAAFLIPLIERLLTGNKEFTSLVVVPTRELAIQVTEEFKSLTKHMGFSSACFIGGTSVEKDIQKLRKFNHLIIGTPGRLLDMAERNALRMNDISVLVLDEFDRMLDMGFVNDIRKMVRMIGRREQTLLFSATMDPGQKDIIREIIGTPELIKVSSGSEPSTNVEQHLVRIREDENKFEVLVDMVNDDSFEKVIIFAETKRMVDKLSKKLNRSGIKASHIHGDKSQNYRNRAIRRFREGTCQILVATDVAARGIDIAEVSHVINYQVPRTKDSYVHRIGRTGRAGNSGMAYTFVD
jgi:ATP-dependent RNA helicase RhlE